MKLKNLLKKIKTAESNISTFLGVLVVLFVGYLVFKYFQGIGNQQTQNAGLNSEIIEVKPEENELIKELPTNYQIKEGDSLWKIALNFYGSGYNWVDLVKENNFENPNLIFPGTQISLPKVSKRVPKTDVKTVRLEAISSNNYRVVKGDNLWNIALRAYGNGFRWQEIAKANNLSNPNLIHAGNILTIPR